MNTAYVALVIGYLQPDLVQNVLFQLSQQTILPQHVLIVDNGGTFTEGDRASWPLADRSRLISRPDNPGYAAAVNEARDLRSEGSLLVLTHDANFPKDLAESLLGALTHGVGSAGPLLYFRDEPTRLFSAGGKLSKSGLASHLRRSHSINPYAVDWLDGAIVMFNRAALDEIDWLDEQYFLYFEDVDTGWRLRLAGWSNVIHPAVIGFQQPGSQPPFLGARNMVLFARKAGVSPLRRSLATMNRIVRVSLGELRQKRRPPITQMVRGFRAGSAEALKPDSTTLK